MSTWAPSVVGNASSGLMAGAGACRVTACAAVLVVFRSVPPRRRRTSVSTGPSTADFLAMSAAKGADLFVMAASPPLHPVGQRTRSKSRVPWLTLEWGDSRCAAGWSPPAPTPDMCWSGSPRTPRIRSLLELGRAKLARKGCDLLVLNQVGPGLVFGQQNSEITVIGGLQPVGPLAGSKDTLAHRIWDEALAVRPRR